MFPVWGNCIPRMLHAHATPMWLEERREGTEGRGGEDRERRELVVAHDHGKSPRWCTI